MAKQLTIGYIGNGKSTNRYHLPFALKLGDKIKVKTIYTPSGKMDWAQIEGVHYTTDLYELLNDPDIQVVVITTPSQYHYELAKQVLIAGKNCVVEKPFTETVAQAEELFALAKEMGLMLQCYQNRRFDSDFLTVQEVIKSGKLGDLLELEMHFDYFRPEVPENTTSFSRINSYLYGHACHTLDQVISLFGEPDSVHYDVRQLLGKGRMNDYFDIDLYYGVFKVSVKSSFFRIKSRPSFVIYGKKGMFVKETKDRQEEHLKQFYMPDNADFGLDKPEHYGVLTYMDELGIYHEEKVPSVAGDYSRYYQALYDTLINGQVQEVTAQQTLLQIRLLEKGIKSLS